MKLSTIAISAILSSVAIAAPAQDELRSTAMLIQQSEEFQRLNYDEGLLSLPDRDELRLVETAPGVRTWMTEAEKLVLKRQGVRFFDVTSDDQIRANEEVPLANVTFPHSPQYKDKVAPLLENINTDNMHSNLAEFTDFFTRYYKSQTGRESAKWLYKQVNQLAHGYKGGNKKPTVEYFAHPWGQPSIIARLPGSKNPDTIVVVGAHQDSTNLIAPSLFAAPGADDDGSGTVTILESFRVLMESGFEPENTVEFHWYSAEEGGLLGSQEVYKQYFTETKDVRAMLQQDMTGYAQGMTDAGVDEHIGVITDFVSPDLTVFVKSVIDTYCDIPYVDTQCGYACSDHASATKYGYPSSFVIESGFQYTSKFIHTTKDTLDRLSFEHMRQHAKLTIGYAYELAFAKLEKH